jgi:hypothetical protein
MKPEYEIADDGIRRWYLNGKLHREDGPAVEYPNGTKKWYLYGKYHREDGPAVEFANGHKGWYFNGKLNREDGPAVVHNNGSKFWFLDDTEYTEKEYYKKLYELGKISYDEYVLEMI